MIEWTGRNTEGTTIGTMTAEDPHDLFTKLDAWVRNDRVPDYFERDLIVEFLDKKEPKLAKLGKDIEQADADSDDELTEQLFEKQTDLIYNTIDLLDDQDVLALIEFAGEAFKNEFKEYIVGSDGEKLLEIKDHYYELVISSDGACWVKTYDGDFALQVDITHGDFQEIYKNIMCNI